MSAVKCTRFVFIPTSLQVSENLKTSGWTKYDSINGWQDYSDYADIAEDGRSAVLEYTDGGFGDADGVVNGYIVDPSGPAEDPSPASNSGGGGGCIISAIWQ